MSCMSCICTNQAAPEIDVATLSVSEAVKAFHAQTKAVLETTPGMGSRASALALHISTLLKAIVMGPSTHNTQVRPRAELGAPGTGETVSISVYWQPATIFTAEIATRSRISHQVRLLPEVRFALENPGKLGREGKAVLRAEGFSFPALPEIARLRRKLKDALGEYDEESAFAWWCKHKDTEFPLKTSKFHRIWESLWGMKSLQTIPVPTSNKINAFWAYLHSVNLEVHAFEFELGDDSTPAVVQARVSYSSQEAEMGRICEGAGGRSLVNDRTLGEKFAASAVNFCALVHSQRAGAPGANCEVIAKLLSSAQWWGPAKSGWQRWDETWQCTDKTNLLGQVTAKQGRLIWRMDTQTAGPRACCSLQSGKRPDEHSSVSSTAFYLFVLIIIAQIVMMLWFLYPLGIQYWLQLPRLH
eukprot:TRINITY_DN14404_c0_g1_i1.p1 TRINITY_DN14404_c0_g1~~TRINITY_DN14404_c0_g1_i1.p1  ORF type:complete len:415 (-),score=48.83 TRINITY_DN14404_c0_g1_i1:333-1577(-)